MVAYFLKEWWYWLIWYWWIWINLLLVLLITFKIQLTFIFIRYFILSWIRILQCFVYFLQVNFVFIFNFNRVYFLYFNFLFLFHNWFINYLNISICKFMCTMSKQTFFTILTLTFIFPIFAHFIFFPCRYSLVLSLYILFWIAILNYFLIRWLTNVYIGYRLLFFQLDIKFGICCTRSDGLG